MTHIKYRVSIILSTPFLFILLFKVYVEFLIKSYFTINSEIKNCGDQILFLNFNLFLVFCEGANILGHGCKLYIILVIDLLFWAL